MNDLTKNLKNFQQKQVLFSLLLLLFLLTASVGLNNWNMSSRAEQTAKLVSRMVQEEEFREVRTTLEQAKLEDFNQIKFISGDGRHSFTVPEIAEIENASPSFLNRLIYSQLEISISEMLTKKDTAVFVFNRFLLFPKVLLLWILLLAIIFPQTWLMKKRIIKQFEKDLEIQASYAQAEISKTVRHNIRTPLSALLRFSAGLASVSPDDKTFLEGIISQIQSLILDLDSKSRGLSPYHEGNLAVTIRQGIQEAKLTLPRGISFHESFDDMTWSARSLFVPHELRSIITNLITNSVEAMDGDGRIEFKVSDSGSSVIIEVIDSGEGIPPNLLTKVTERGFTFGKRSGSGIGLFHAQECALKWGAKLSVDSRPGNTRVTFELPVQERAQWFLPRIKISNDDEVIVADDQISIHRIFKSRLDEAGFTGKLKCFSTLDAMESYLADGSALPKTTHLFVDHDFGESEKRTGLDSLGAQFSYANRYLVTGNFDDISIQESCSLSGIFLIPKTELYHLPIVTC